MKKQASPVSMDAREIFEPQELSDPATPADLSELPEPTDPDDFLDHISQADLENLPEEQIEAALTGERWFLARCLRDNA